ncbi:hypothetical protein BT96DRAFT_991863 [Gymnopus androsaceus JB14]|uniref:Uncharacterized protein n=1 Tax=Gymnopus androsaceus JB14 TaxID=1447944 RepID=A0A6A4HYM9_9AGAR|nr:hypothetical protein BT96DRAFT_991863 [Gymnopus androsaceus JB14]
MVSRDSNFREQNDTSCSDSRHLVSVGHENFSLSFPDAVGSSLGTRHMGPQPASPLSWNFGPRSQQAPSQSTNTKSSKTPPTSLQETSPGMGENPDKRAQSDPPSLKSGKKKQTSPLCRSSSNGGLGSSCAPLPKSPVLSLTGKSKSISPIPKSPVSSTGKSKSVGPSRSLTNQIAVLENLGLQRDIGKQRVAQVANALMHNSVFLGGLHLKLEHRFLDLDQQVKDAESELATRLANLDVTGDSFTLSLRPHLHQQPPLASHEILDRIEALEIQSASDNGLCNEIRELGSEVKELEGCHKRLKESVAVNNEYALQLVTPKDLAGLGRSTKEGFQAVYDRIAESAEDCCRGECKVLEEFKTLKKENAKLWSKVEKLLDCLDKAVKERNSLDHRLRLMEEANKHSNDYSNFSFASLDRHSSGPNTLPLPPLPPSSRNYAPPQPQTSLPPPLQVPSQSTHSHSDQFSDKDTREAVQSSWKRLADRGLDLS